MSNLNAAEFSLEPVDNQRLASLCGHLDANLRHIERRLGVEINVRGGTATIIGDAANVTSARNVLEQLYDMTHQRSEIESAHVHMALQEQQASLDSKQGQGKQVRVVTTKRGVIRPRGPNQGAYLNAIRDHDVSFGIGPAGTGKTYLAVACAVEALERQEVRRIVLARPAVEAGERLGFLPGDLAQKVDPYLRPLYDALYEMLGFEAVAKLMERNIIEVAPLAYMRGRTLNDAFVILDESQNTTVEQMKMALTRIGFNSRAVVTGDITQVDLPSGKVSGLRHVIEVLNGVKDISFTFFNSADVVRHPVVQSIVRAYEDFESQSGPDGKPNDA